MLGFIALSDTKEIGLRTWRHVTHSAHVSENSFQKSRTFLFRNGKKLDFKKCLWLYKKEVIYANDLTIVKGVSLSDKELRKHIQELDTVPPESFRTEFYLARLDLVDDGELANVLSMRNVGCAPDAKTDMNDSGLFLLNKSLTDFDYRRQDSWLGWQPRPLSENRQRLLGRKPGTPRVVRNRLEMAHSRT